MVNEKRKQLNHYNKLTYRKIAESLSRSRIITRRLETIIDIADLHEDSIVLDIGCGIGFTCNFWMEKSFKVIGVDLSRRLLLLAKKYELGNEYVVGDAEYLPFKPDVFDLAVGIAVLHHIPNDLEVIGEMNRVVRTYGKVAVSEPNVINPYFLFITFFHLLLRTHEHMIHRSLKWRFIKMFRHAGLIDVYVKNVIFTPRNTESKIFKFFSNIERKLEKRNVLNNISACFVIVGEKRIRPSAARSAKQTYSAVTDTCLF